MRAMFYVAVVLAVQLAACEKSDRERVLLSPADVCAALKKEGVATQCATVELPVPDARYLSAKRAVKFDGAGLAIGKDGETAKPGETEVAIVEYESLLKMDEAIGKLVAIDADMLKAMNLDPEKFADKRGRFCKVGDRPMAVHVPNVSNDPTARARIAAIERVTKRPCPPPQ